MKNLHILLRGRVISTSEAVVALYLVEPQPSLAVQSTYTIKNGAMFKYKNCQHLIWKSNKVVKRKQDFLPPTTKFTHATHKPLQTRMILEWEQT